MLGRDAGLLVGPVVGLELGGRDEPDLAVESSMVEPVDVLGDGDLNVAHRLPAAFRARMTGLRMHSALNSELSASAIALSYESPRLPTDATASASASRSV